MKKLCSIALAMTVFAGCASVPMESPEKSAEAKQFNPPADGMAGLYVYRDTALGGALKKDMWINGECLGTSGPKVFFYKELPGGQRYDLATESEFSPNHITLDTTSGENHFVKQVMKMGVFVGGAKLVPVTADVGKSDIADLELAKNGFCDKISIELPANQDLGMKDKD